MNIAWGLYIKGEKLKHLKGSLAEVYYEMSFNNLPCCEMKMMGINGVLKCFGLRLELFKFMGY